MLLETILTELADCTTTNTRHCDSNLHGQDLTEALPGKVVPCMTHPQQVWHASVGSPYVGRKDFKDAHAK